MFPYNLFFFPSSSVKTTIGNLINISLVLQVTFILMIWFFQSKNIIFVPISLCHLLLLSSVSWCLKVFRVQAFSSLGRLIPQHFILLDVIVSGMVSLISLSKLLLLIYRYTKDFSVNFISFVSFSLPNSLMSSSSFLLVSLDFSMYGIMSAAISVSFLLLFQYGFLLICFSSLITVARTSKIVLNKLWEMTS